MRKVVPPPETMRQAALGFARDAAIARLVSAQERRLAREAEAAAGRLDLEAGVRRLLEAEPALSWDGAVRRLVNGEDQP